MTDSLKIRYEGRPRPWARPHTYRDKRGGFRRIEDKKSHWSRTAMNAMTKLWNEAWLSRPARLWDSSRPMALHVTAHFDGTHEGGCLEAEIIPLTEGGYTSAPDLDNVVKLCLEAAQKAGIVKNDAQVCILVAEKKKQ